ncbi:MAG: hypothetical protein KA372_02405, partial [Dokdonella sp.]|nr:hypothetical protein [Dokdonella sp.]
SELARDNTMSHKIKQWWERACSRQYDEPQNQAVVGASLLATIFVQTFLCFRRSREGGLRRSGYRFAIPG